MDNEPMKEKTVLPLYPLQPCKEKLRDFVMMGGSWKRDFVIEAKKQLWIAFPLFFAALLQFLLQVMSLMFVGRLGKSTLAGVSLSISFAYVTGFTVLMGLASTLDTLCGQSFGAQQLHMVGVHTQRAMVVLLSACILIAALWANTERILIVMHQDHEMSRVAGVYSYYMIPSLFAYAILQCLMKFLQTQNNVYPMMLASVVTTLCHGVVCWALVLKSVLGYRGAALATSISYWLNVVFLAGYIKCSLSIRETWTGFSKEAIQNIPTFLKVAVPSTFMLCLKCWTFEIVLILSGLLPNPKLETSVMSICLNTSSLVWMLPFGLSAAISTRVSNELGANQPNAAKLATQVVMFMVLAQGILVATAMISLRSLWGHVYTREKDVIRHVASMMPLLAVASFLDGIQSVLSGIARGSGWQKIGSIINLGSYYILGVPCAVVLGFVFHLKSKAKKAVIRVQNQRTVVEGANDVVTENPV
ncbi:unnamed protein product [Cuscuta campestris]|uniref:Protein DETOXIFICATION n=1 Tax=Cuscuta campestris TaxID=132261 RepID=A0A484MTH7_9ASTE|nr:unnamed protein product [Cuscuta campestris]